MVTDPKFQLATHGFTSVLNLLSDLLLANDAGQLHSPGWDRYFDHYEPQVGMGRVANPAGLVLTFSPRLYQVCFMYVMLQHHILIDVGRNEKKHGA